MSELPPTLRSLVPLPPAGGLVARIAIPSTQKPRSPSSSLTKRQGGEAAWDVKVG